MDLRLTSIAATILLSLLPLVGLTQDKRPNVVMIVVDDMRFDEYGAGGHQYLDTPNIDSLAESGATFTNAYHVTPLCSPNRASLLTGQYPSRHGVSDNTSRSHTSHRLDLFAIDLQKAGYQTAHVGKWHMGNDPTPRPGYDYWVSFAGQGRTVNPELFENGRTEEVKGYITDLLTDRAVDFIDRSGDQPFFLYVAHKAVHPDLTQLDDGTADLSRGSKFVPADRHQGVYEDRVIERAPNFGFSEADAAGKPVLLQALKVKQSAAIKQQFGSILDEGTSENSVRRRAEMMLAIDESTGRILKALRASGDLDDTVIIFTSDNGYFFGEHGLSIERRLPYEEALRAPLLIRYDKIEAQGTQVEGLVLSIDLAATILNFAQVPVPATVQGRSVLPLLDGSRNEIRDVGYMEYYSHENPMPWTVDLDYRVVRKGPYKYIHWLRFPDKAELYNLDSDPYEVTNLIGDSALAPVISDLRAALAKHAVDALGLGVD